MEMYLVGGAVRDKLLGLHPKDMDFAVEAESYEEMRDELVARGFEIFLETPQYVTIRARFPAEWDTSAYGMTLNRLTADFTLCRRDGEYSDGRRPDEVFPGTLRDDLARRDFTVNAMAFTWAGELIDPFGGQKDLGDRVLRCVGSPQERLREDALRALRAVRFAVTKNMVWSNELHRALQSAWLPPLLESVSVERKREELHRAFKHNTLWTLDLLTGLDYRFMEAVFSDGLWLKPTTEGGPYGTFR